MYPSGIWRGHWEQVYFGRQPMTDFYLRFTDHEVEGSGVDVIGKFVIHGDYDPAAGEVKFAKQYVGRHTVLYQGRSDGEGSILGKWSILDGDASWTGPFAISPAAERANGDEPIFEIVK